ncbi:MAG: threonine synthase [Chitinispirillaceae bacterium]
MRYISTRDNSSALPSARAIDLGMVPAGGLFVPEEIPALPEVKPGESYQETAVKVLSPFLSDFSEDEVASCVNNAYTGESFDVPGVIELAQIGSGKFVLELWHGPTAAFKDVALQIMPQFMKFAKVKSGNSSHTLILVATSGDTGKAALEGFRDTQGISIVVFYPHGGVSEIQKLQMATTEGANTHVVAVKGNFDDCQSGVKELFGDEQLRKAAAEHNVVFSSANSINWGRLCPQIVYYVKSYFDLVEKGKITSGEKIDFCVPTGNFGNILAGYYAKEMGLPVRRLICASNKNKVLTDFFKTGVYDRNRSFHRTMSPSMDILISSNLERFLFEITGHDARMVNRLYAELSETGKFDVGDWVRNRMASLVEADWVSEEEVLNTIGTTFKEFGYVLDTHTAVAVAAANRLSDDGTPVVIASTASPYKFSGDVLAGLGGEKPLDEFESINMLRNRSNTPVHRAVDGLRQKAVRHDEVIQIEKMRETVQGIIGTVS